MVLFLAANLFQTVSQSFTINTRNTWAAVAARLVGRSAERYVCAAEEYETSCLKGLTLSLLDRTRKAYCAARARRWPICSRARWEIPQRTKAMAIRGSNSCAYSRLYGKRATFRETSGWLANDKKAAVHDFRRLREC